MNRDWTGPLTQVEETGEGIAPRLAAPTRYLVGGYKEGQAVMV